MNINPKQIAKMITEDPNEVVPSDHFDDTEDEYVDGWLESVRGVHQPDLDTEIHVDLISRGDSQDEWRINYLRTPYLKRRIPGDQDQLQGVLTIYHIDGEFNGWHWSSTDKKWEPDHATDEIQQILDCFAEAYHEN